MTKFGSRWNLAPRGVKAAIIVGTLLFVAVLSITFIDRATRGRQLSSSDTRGSARSTAGNGTKALRLLLEQYGHQTKDLDGSPLASVSNLPPTATLMVLNIQFPSDRARATVLRFAQRGGRLVIGGTDAAAWLETQRPSPTSGLRHVSRVDISGRRHTVRTDGLGRWRTAAGPQLVVTRRVGAGQVFLLADATPLQNFLLASNDNASFALALAGTRTQVAFAEASAGHGGATGWDAVPSGWKVAIIGGAIALLLTAVARGRRIGSAEPEQRLLAPPRRATADVLAAGLQRSRRPALALDTLASAARAHVIQRANLEPDADRATIVAAAIAAGWEPDEAAALVTPPSDRSSVLALGRAFARSQKGSS